LVVLASLYGLPVSTTHVSVGSLFGLGSAPAKVKSARRQRDRFLLAHYSPPCAAILSGLIYWSVTLFALNRFADRLPAAGRTLRRTKTEVLQVNVGKLCNLTSRRTEPQGNHKRTIADSPSLMAGQDRDSIVDLNRRRAGDDSGFSLFHRASEYAR